MASGEIYYLANFHPRQICQVVYDYYSRIVVVRRIDTLETVFQAAARNFTIWPAEASAKYLCSLMRRAETLATRNRMPAVRHILVSADIVRIDWSSHGKCNCQSRPCSKWPSQSIGEDDFLESKKLLRLRPRK